MNVLSSFTLADRQRPSINVHTKLAVALIASVSATLMIVALTSSRGNTQRAISTLGNARSHTPAPGFPMVCQLVRPGEEAAFTEVKGNWETYHTNGGDALIPLYLPELELWPEAGGFDELVQVLGSDPDLKRGRAIEYLLLLDREEAVASFGDEDSRNDETSSLIKNKKKQWIPKAVVDGREEFASTSLGHLAAWLEARQLNNKSLLISDCRTKIENHMGPPADFDSFLMSFLYKGPDKNEWDVLFLDKGERGVEAGDLKTPFLTFSNEKWKEDYYVYRNKMTCQAGDGFYLVSGVFLRRVPEMLKSNPFTAVDGWLSVLCRDGKLKCFSHAQKDWEFRI